MKVVLVAINSKYIHSNLAVYNLKSYADDFEIHIREFTINQQKEKILMDLYNEEADIYCFSTYIWNRDFVISISKELGKITKASLFFGGPEVSYDSEKFLEENTHASIVMKGEGEETFKDVLTCISENKSLENIPGITYRKDGEIISNKWRRVMPLSDVPFIYKEFEDSDIFDNKIIYYESSRGCPFRCSYCLSSVDKKLRFRDITKVKKEIQFFLDKKVPQVKFVDRTFNCVKKHSFEIWKYIYENDNKITNFHFEISADLLDKDSISLLNKMRPGLVQLEIGVQSTNPQTLKAIKRTASTEKIRKNVALVNKGKNIHQHLDLIAGLPYEDYTSFSKSFDDVYKMEPNQLQLGFLKVLEGSFISENRKDYGLVHVDNPPYEVLKTKWLSYGDIIKLKGIEEMVETY